MESFALKPHWCVVFPFMVFSEWFLLVHQTVHCDCLCFGNALIGELPKLCEKISILMQANVLIADWYVAHSFPHS